MNVLYFIILQIDYNHIKNPLNVRNSLYTNLNLNNKINEKNTTIRISTKIDSKY